jgi:hypothetical protein
MGISAAALVDLDILEPQSHFCGLMRAALVPDLLLDSWEQLRDSFDKKYKGLGTKPKERGVAGLQGPDREALEEFLDLLATYGVFAVPVGEVEGWLKGLGVPGKKVAWLIAMLERLGADPADPNYVRPGEGDVWAFLRRIKKWADDPGRKGIPE